MALLRFIGLVAVAAACSSPTKKYGPLVTLEKVETIEVGGGAYVEPMIFEANGPIA